VRRARLTPDGFGIVIDLTTRWRSVEHPRALSKKRGCIRQQSKAQSVSRFINLSLLAVLPTSWLYGQRVWQVHIIVWPHSIRTQFFDGLLVSFTLTPCSPCRWIKTEGKRPRQRLSNLTSQTSDLKSESNYTCIIEGWTVSIDRAYTWMLKVSVAHQ